MGFFDQINSMLGTNFTPDNMLQTAMNVLNSPAVGGVHGLLDKLNAQGLKQIADSWISTGSNQPISAEQISQVLGAAKLDELAAKFGLSTSVLSQQLAQMLPQVVDKLTPNGKLPDASTIAQGLQMLQQTFFKK